MEKIIKNESIKTKTNIIINSNKIETSDTFEPVEVESILTDLGNVIKDIVEVLEKYNISKLDCKGMIFKDGQLYLSDSEIIMDNENK